MVNRKGENGYTSAPEPKNEKKLKELTLLSHTSKVEENKVP